MSFAPIKELISKRANRLRLKKEADLLIIASVWSEIKKELGFGDEVDLVSFKRGKLIVSCTSLSEAANLRFLSGKIKKEINKNTKKINVKEIIFRPKN